MRHLGGNSSSLITQGEDILYSRNIIGHHTGSSDAIPLLIVNQKEYLSSRKYTAGKSGLTIPQNRSVQKHTINASLAIPSARKLTFSEV